MALTSITNRTEKDIAKLRALLSINSKLGGMSDAQIIAHALLILRTLLVGTYTSQQEIADIIMSTHAIVTQSGDVLAIMAYEMLDSKTDAILEINKRGGGQ